ncbi:MAG TPA: acetyltransferase [Gammaproteobacteria bacterium]|nr:acetyltransferase [Gammaproteobacteria bacterium]
MILSGSRSPDQEIAEAVRAACIQAALNGYENASISGLCAEGAFEAAISAIRMLDLKMLTEGLNDDDR